MKIEWCCEKMFYAIRDNALLVDGHWTKVYGNYTVHFKGMSKRHNIDACPFCGAKIEISVKGDGK